MRLPKISYLKFIRNNTMYPLFAKSQPMTGIFSVFSVCDLYFFRQKAMIDGERRRKS